MTTTAPERATSLQGLVPAVAGIRLMIVETDETFGALWAAWLGDRGWLTHRFVTGRAALREWDAVRPDLVMMSLGLPDMDSFEFLATLRTFPQRPPVVICASSLAVQRWGPDTHKALGIAAVMVRPGLFSSMEARLLDIVREDAISQVPTLLDDDPLSARSPK